MLGVKSCSKILTINCTHKSDTGEFKRLSLSSSEMTEEEMIDLALRLSEQEASIVAIRRQKEEEEAMMKAIRESVSTKWLIGCKCGHLVSQSLFVASVKDKLAARLNREHEPIQGSQQCPDSLLHNEISNCFVQMSQQDQPYPSESQSLLDETDAPSMIRTRRKLTYSNGRSTSAVSQGPSGGGCTSNNNQRRGEAPNSAVIFLTLILLVSAQRGALFSRISNKQNIFCLLGF